MCHENVQRADEPFSRLVPRADVNSIEPGNVRQTVSPAAFEYTLAIVGPKKSSQASVKAFKLVIKYALLS